ncbi:MAG: hypothetical protein Q7U04_17460 [Bacteriovorax sp.]|nr:hypothetical protein [Bacteriovorax sp.]
MNLLLIFKIHLSATLYMVGVICLIQIINYPLFALVGKKDFPIYHAKHIRMTSFVIAIPMLVEIISLGLLLYLDTFYRNNSLFIISALFLVINWSVTFLISVPLHDILALGFDQKAWQKLVSTNWIRTISWIARAILLLEIQNQF